jgi:uncharacterized repeat protein (TIGR03803 family)
MRNATLTPSARILQILLVPILALSTAWAAPKFQVLHAFGQGADAAYPTSPLLDHAGNLIGISEFGGILADCTPYGCGAAFELSQVNGYWRESVFYSFTSFPNAVGTLAVDAHGNVYGVQDEGGDPSCNCGAVYQLTQSGGVWTENLLHNFVGGNGSDGAYPSSGLVRDAGGNLYGATAQGGINNAGTIFELSPNSDGTWTYSVIYEFLSTNYLDAVGPGGPLTIDAPGNLYGTTSGGGEFGYGAVFRISLSNGGWTESILSNFTLDFGSQPYPDGVVLDGAGNLYGTTLDGGDYGTGTVYKLAPAVGYWRRTVLHTFSGDADGAYPYGPLAIDASGSLYGGTNYGGSFGYGTIYKLAVSNGKWTESTLHAFTNGKDGARSITGVVLDSQGNLYGTALDGGAYGFGVLFEITP